VKRGCDLLILSFENQNQKIAACGSSYWNNAGDNQMSNEKYEKGLKIRTQVLGEAYVNRSIENADDFNRPLQEMVTEYCWGHVWGREGLSLKERSMINLAMISALNRPHELKLHVRGALRNGLSREQIREILLQVGIYCGVPAAVDSFRLAREAFAEADAEASS
jgi:4-carboxymuconolactone decarboxylase